MGPPSTAAHRDSSQPSLCPVRRRSVACRATKSSAEFSAYMPTSRWHVHTVQPVAARRFLNGSRASTRPLVTPFLIPGRFSNEGPQHCRNHEPGATAPASDGAPVQFSFELSKWQRSSQADVAQLATEEQRGSRRRDGQVRPPPEPSSALKTTSQCCGRRDGALGRQPRRHSCCWRSRA